MNILSDEIVSFLQTQRFFVVSTIGLDGCPHSSCKDIVKIDHRGKVYLLDLYKGNTYKNLKQNPHLSLTAVDEHKFRGYLLKGKAKIIKRNNLSYGIKKAWNSRITSRITHRFLKNIRGEKGHPRHPEALLPRPEYLIVMEVKQVIDLTPGHLK